MTATQKIPGNPIRSLWVRPPVSLENWGCYYEFIFLCTLAPCFKMLNG